MKNVVQLVLFCISPAFYCFGQDTWQNYNTGNSPLSSNSVSSILLDHQNNLWGAYAGAGGNGPGVVKFNGTNWTHFSASVSGLPNNDVRAIAVDAQGSLWFACYNAGIVSFDGSTWTRYNVSNSGIAGNDVVTMKFDHNNNLWVGCYSSGVSKFNGTTWTTYTKSNAPFPDNNCINTITIGQDNSVWVGMDCQGGLAKFSPLSNTWINYKTTNSDIADHTVTSIFEDVGGKMWLSYLNNYVSSFDGTTWTHYTPQKKISGFVSDKNGQLWGCGNGLFKLVGSNWHESTLDGATDNYSFPSQSLTVATDGRFWLSVQGKGIWTNPDPLVSTFERTTDGFIPVYAGKIKWADLDNDLDQDILYCGYHEGSPLTMVYENINGTFSARSTNLPNVRNGSFATGDFDKDGDLDVLISGLSDIPITELYRNNGNFNFSLAFSFPALINSTMSWMDLDNDSDLDFLLTGAVWTEAAGPYVYENKGGLFELLTGTNLPSCMQCSMDWADSNGDGKTDLLLSGFSGTSGYETSLYLNNGNKTFTKDVNSVLKSLYNGDAQWGDFDNDNDMDALISGFSSDGLPYTLVYENKNGVLEERTDIHITTAGENWWSGTAWADFNNDGKLDILVTGRGNSQVVLSYGFKIFLNYGQGQFVEAIDADFGGIADSSVDCVDYDGDGDPDISFLGITTVEPVTGIYKNKFDELPTINNTPSFEVSSFINVEEDFETFSILLKPAAVAPWETNQTVVYSIEALDEIKVIASINAATGKITLSAVPDAFGSTTYQVTANDGQPEHNTYSATIQVSIFPVSDAPSLSEFEDLEFEFNGTIGLIPFTVQDVDKPVTGLDITATSSNDAIIKDGKIFVVGTGTNRFLNIMPERDVFGETTITVRVSNDALFTERQFKITFADNVTGLEQSLTQTIKLFPNPVSTSLTVAAGQQINAPITIIVSDVRGSEVRRFMTTNASAVIDMTDLNTGVYILRILDGQEFSKPLKVVKK